MEYYKTGDGTKHFALSSSKSIVVTHSNIGFDINVMYFRLNRPSASFLPSTSEEFNVALDLATAFLIDILSNVKNHGKGLQVLLPDAPKK